MVSQRTVCATIVLACLLSAGCLIEPSQDLRSAAISQQFKPIVIALLDSGTNPYLPIFAVDDDEVVGFVGVEYEDVHLDITSTWETAQTADRATLDALEPYQLYHFAGTRLLAISFDANRTFPQTIDGDIHGSSTSYLAAREAPHAIIVMVQITPGVCTQDASCLVEPEVAAGMEWIAAQSWIDVVSVSLGVPGQPPDADAVHPEAGRFLRASEAAARSGKIIVNGAGNHVVPPLMGYFAGPPWVVSVGGVDPYAHGEPVQSALIGFDVSANWTEWAPRFLNGTMTWVRGTSMATPVVAGTIAQALHLIREADPGAHHPVSELRDALNSSSVILPSEGWSPGPAGKGDLPFDLVNYASLPILVQPQQGWGYVNASLAPEIARRVIEQDFSIPAEKDQAMLFQPAWQQAREEYWAKMRSS